MSVRGDIRKALEVLGYHEQGSKDVGFKLGYMGPNEILLKKGRTYVKVKFETGPAVNYHGDPYTPDPDGGFNPYR